MFYFSRPLSSIVQIGTGTLLIRTGTFSMYNIAGYSFSVARIEFETNLSILFGYRYIAVLMNQFSILLSWKYLALTGTVGTVLYQYFKEIMK